MSTGRGMARLQRKPAIAKNYIRDRRQGEEKRYIEKKRRMAQVSIS